LTSTFDLTASTFDRYRALPAGVAESVRKTIWYSTGAPPDGRVLDLGAGSGRFGSVFVEAGDYYVGVDASMAMLQQFHERSPSACLLHADGGRLPLKDNSFDLVLLMQVLSGAENWRNLLCETARVIVPGGFVVVGQTTGPTGSIDSRMKRQLAQVLQELGAPAQQGEKSRKQALQWLATGASRQMHVVAASWPVQRAPREFLERHRTGARFSTLPPAIQKRALQNLAAWAEKKFKSLDKPFTEEHSFELEIFRIGRR
jgi:ubiquinone/menaquinone biosynthesis C-methylase UbiE